MTVHDVDIRTAAGAAYRAASWPPTVSFGDDEVLADIVAPQRSRQRW
jgi:hypothetical protein